MVTDLKHVVPLGLLRWGEYPNVDHKPITYLYRRPNNNLYLYRTTDQIELVLSDVSVYDNNILVYYDTNHVELQDVDITKLTSVSIIESKATIGYEWSQRRNTVIYFAVPAIFNLMTIWRESLDVTEMFSLSQVFIHNGAGYYVYESRTAVALDVSEKFQVVFARITDEEVDAFLLHIGQYDNPHRVNKDQVGLPNVDNTSDMDKPISTAQREEFDRLESKIDNNQEWVEQNIDRIDAKTAELEGDLGDLRNVVNENNNSLNARIDREVATLNQTIVTNVNTINTRITNEVATLNQRISDEVAALDAAKSTVTWLQTGGSVAQDVESIINLKIIRGTTAQLERVPIVDKQLVFNTESQQFFVDTSNQRIILANNGLERVVNANANTVRTPGVYWCTGSKTNFPTENNLNQSTVSFALFVQNNGETAGYTQQIAIGSKRWTRTAVGTVMGTWVSFDTGELTDLRTTNKTSLVAAINSIYGQGVYSETIDRIEVIPAGSEVPIGQDNILYIEIPDYLDGIDYMEIIMPAINPPFLVR